MRLGPITGFCLGTLALLLLGMVSLAGEETSLGVGEDAIAPPPQHQTILSPEKTHILVLQAAEDWSLKQLTATLYEVNDTACQPLWSQVLPQEYGPRFVLVTNQGHTVLLDEWINVASNYAVMVLNAAGQTVAQHGFDAVAQVLQVPRSDIVERARHGWWITREPTLSRDGQTVEVGAAGKRLHITVSNGQLLL